MDKEKIVSIVRKVEPFGYALVGIVIFSYGTSYFQERLLYNVPRILIPVFNIFGNIGLAIGMLILGGGFIYWGFTKWKAAAEKKNLYWIFAIIALVIGVALTNINFNPNKSAEIMEEMGKERKAQMEALRNSGDLGFSNPHVDAYIAEFNALYKRFENIKNRDEKTINAHDDELMAWRAKSADIMKKISDKEKGELARYMGKLSLQWYDLKMKYSGK